MRKFTELDAIAASLPQDNVDTDKILPGEFLKTVSRAGLGAALFARMRYREDGSENLGFILNRDPWRNAGILIAGHNFGCGSSREHAPWALIDFGISVIIAKSFADIFYNNCFKNGILPIILELQEHERFQRLAEIPATARMKIDLVRQCIEADGAYVSAFDIDAGRKAALLEGVDEIGETLRRQEQIDAWRRQNVSIGEMPAISVARE
ncbi:3-isopropylmalate dehydratase small subunit (plasmid) [Sphingobium sp. SJ10-10]|uniref:3-isopropylmalate dehydratase small subunit n=1 Tax=Sphingomonas sp. NS2 TaxID=908605 RepID=A0A0D4ZZL6_9SPHN|nr:MULTISPECIES: 3-isopropylmalate dehydratase small subunit [unclassified Sphingobium]AJW29381.1 3-isopropylmalate dehydratase small subunit [Sphingomonas sp. NS2]AMK26582.1 3-isopropylmalate dehydratase small subunit [Sphingobium sp. TKS]MEC6699602.1 3-isopropylmalate dehydratase small subunit [Sphingobium sp. SJ10-10]NML91708.1 3-isopropylmalate dehydratase small subunit [Sphingobium sp. TB-6]